MFEIKEINEALAKLDFTPYHKPGSALERKSKHQGIPDEYGDGIQGQSNIFEDIYPTSQEGVFLKATVETDSYGEEYRITELKLVKAVEKQVTTYEYE